MAPSFKPSLPAMRFMFGHATLYIAIFLAGAVISLSAVRSLLLQYIPNSYTAGGVLSWSGAAAMGVACVVLVNFFNTFLSGILG